jgi:hypothetical protein
MSSSPSKHFDEDSWHEGVRRRELHRCAISLSQFANYVQFTEDFPSDTPKSLAKLIEVTAKLIAEGLKTIAPAQDLEQINTILGIITSHLRYVERARVAQTPWSVVQTAERLLKQIAGPGSNFILRPTWTYNYSIIGEFVSAYREFISSWSWFPFQAWKEQMGINEHESIYCISFPRVERTNCLMHANWGHEVGHILVAKWVDTDFGNAWAKDESKIKERIENHIKKDWTAPPKLDKIC